MMITAVSAFILAIGLQTAWVEADDGRYTRDFDCRIADASPAIKASMPGRPEMALKATGTEDTITSITITLSGSDGRSETMTSRSCDTEEAVTTEDDVEYPGDVYQCSLVTSTSGFANFYGRQEDGGFTLLRIRGAARYEDRDEPTFDYIVGRCR